MLKKILSGEDCAACRFCCSFRRQSLWETPLFTENQKQSLEKKYPAAVFKRAGKQSWTVELLHLYRTEDPEEEAPCPFLGSNGCVLDSEEKPFDCSIWPLRVCRKDGEYKVMLEDVCPAINKVPVEKVQELVLDDGLGRKIIDQAKKNPDMEKEFQPGYVILM